MMGVIKVATPKTALTEEEALDTDADITPKLYSLQNTIKFKDALNLRRSEIENLIHRHLGISQSDFVLSERAEWICGSFNICLPIHISSTHHLKLPQRALIRFPLPFGVGETFDPGNADEKLRCEAATYIWLQSNCPTIPIPRLLGMGFPGMQSFTAIENESLWNRIVWYVRRSLTWMHGSTLPPYFAHQRNCLFDHGYLLMEYVEEGRMLSSSWAKHRGDENRQGNLYRSLAKIMLSLASVPLPRIGSWTMDDRGVISLTNRPLLDLTLLWSRHRIPTDIPRNMTYSSTQPFVHDLLTLQDTRMRYQLNSILSITDGLYQLSALTALRSLISRFWDHHTRNGPFVLTLADLHQSNILVDDEWNITRLIDFEFAPVRPVQMNHVPYWLSDKGVDQLAGPDLDEYKALYDEFLTVLEREEIEGQHSSMYSQKLREDWDTGRLWFSMALGSINAFPAIFEQHLQPKFYTEFEMDPEGKALANLWDTNVFDFIDKKLEDQKRYKEEVHKIFAEIGFVCEGEETEGAANAEGQEKTETGACKSEEEKEVTVNVEYQEKTVTGTCKSGEEVAVITEEQGRTATEVGEIKSEITVSVVDQGETAMKACESAEDVAANGEDRGETGPSACESDSEIAVSVARDQGES
ncbi:hypothetical protein EJ05DRAFT_512686 [Pseudovirgaria hyperparasitica]|uniref:Aminoglycoside phosphotransferase domain-containing protein n=1 Tax=Pseudovirgaria hyperparasitica TaxID=470096 RepID=A0A6A6W264_9PEZI|nr:uncharacterized protein EJ05DRAFT_512686 [Pseudovirgaria hyperparasitica]KAF2756136.1 hypothetical protein EJ05DRAFT_512686 [Pseudovirgaria hyperparasitica]